jgi:hypothetical protein
MKKSTLALVALLLTTPALADEAAKIEPQLVLAAADITPSAEQPSLSATDLGSFLDEQVKQAGDLLNAKITADLTAFINNSTALALNF